MDIKQNPGGLIKPIVPQPDLGKIGDPVPRFPHPDLPLPNLPGPIRRPDRDRMEFKSRDEDKNGVLTSDEYGVGKKKQAEFQRYDTNDDGKVTMREFKVGRLLDRLRSGKVKPMPFPGPFPLPDPIPMPRPWPGPLPDRGPVFLAGASDLSSLVDKVKKAQEEGK